MFKLYNKKTYPNNPKMVKINNSEFQKSYSQKVSGGVL